MNWKNAVCPKCGTIAQYSIHEEGGQQICNSCFKTVFLLPQQPTEAVHPPEPMPGDPISACWYVLIKGKPTGPYTDSVMASMAANGTTDKNTMVWAEGMKEWEPMEALARRKPRVRPVNDPNQMHTANLWTVVRPPGRQFVGNFTDAELYAGIGNQTIYLDDQIKCASMREWGTIEEMDFKEVNGHLTAIYCKGKVVPDEPKKNSNGFYWCLGILTVLSILFLPMEAIIGLTVSVIFIWITLLCMMWFQRAIGVKTTLAKTTKQSLLYAVVGWAFFWISRFLFR